MGFVIAFEKKQAHKSETTIQIAMVQGNERNIVWAISVFLGMAAVLIADDIPST